MKEPNYLFIFVFFKGRLFIYFCVFQRAIRNLYQLVTLHQKKDEQEEKISDVDTDAQLVTVEQFVVDLTKITGEITKDGYAFYAPPSSQ